MSAAAPAVGERVVDRVLRKTRMSGHINIYIVMRVGLVG